MTKIFADGADLATMIELAKDQRIKGFTTNPTLMKKAGVTDYVAFGIQLCQKIPDRPISFEVLSDHPHSMMRQAQIISSWGKNAVVKIPVTNSKGLPMTTIIDALLNKGIKVNVTAAMTPAQVREICSAIRDREACISIFAGRIADTSRDPIFYVREALNIMQSMSPQAELIWASPREVLNYYEAEMLGCHIITMTPDLIYKLNLKNIGLEDYSLETVRMFYEDGIALAKTVGWGDK